MQREKKARMDKVEEDSKGLQLWVLKTCKPNSFAKFTFIVFSV